MHRTSVHGRQGEPMMAISVIDNALWDLKGKWLSKPVHMLIGGPCRKSMPAYASMLGHNVTDMGLVRERATMVAEMGFTAQKWFFRHGPMSGHDGFKANVQMVKTLRETVGEGVDIMLDCWQSMDVNYAIKLATAIEEYAPRWLEEVAMPDRIDSYRKVREKTSIPISGAEHEYTRWGFKRFMDAEAVDIIQPDLNWAGGLSEVLKISAMATAYDLITIAHQGVSPVGMAWSAAQSPDPHSIRRDAPEARRVGLLVRRQRRTDAQQWHAHSVGRARIRLRDRRRQSRIGDRNPVLVTNDQLD